MIIEVNKEGVILNTYKDYSHLKADRGSSVMANVNRHIRKPNKPIYSLAYGSLWIKIDNVPEDDKALLKIVTNGLRRELTYHLFMRLLVKMTDSINELYLGLFKFETKFKKDV